MANLIRGTQIGEEEIDETHINESNVLRKISHGRMDVSSSAIGVDLGDGFGIGTLSPDFKFHVISNNSGNEETLALLQNNNTSSNSGVVLRLANSTNSTAAHHRSEIASIRTSSNGAHDLILRVSSGSSMQDRITIKSAGNVGISVSNPSERLDVDGAINSSEGYKLGGSEVVDSDGRYHAPEKDSVAGIFMNDSAIDRVPSIRLSNPLDSTIAGTIFIDETDDSLNIVGEESVVIDGPLFLTDSVDVGGNLEVIDKIIASHGTADAPSITFSENENTGIYRSSANALAFSANGGVRFLISSSSYIRSYIRHRFVDGSMATPGITWSSDTDTGLSRLAADTINIITGGQERVKVGNESVEINEDTTVSKNLQVSGNLTVLGELEWDGQYNGPKIPWTDLDGYPEINFIAGLNISDGGLGTISLDEGGSVTIETVTNPVFEGGATLGESLNINAFGTPGEHRNYIILKGTTSNNATNEGGGAFVKFQTSTTEGYGPEIGGIRRASGAGDLLIKTGGQNPQERMRVTDNGRVGIGINSPQEILHVQGRALISSPDHETAGHLQVERSGTSSNSNKLKVVISSNPGWQTNALPAGSIALISEKSTAIAFGFEAAESIPLVIRPTGEVGVGTKSPAEALHVEGSIRSSDGYKVGTTEIIDSNRNVKNVNSIDASGNISAQNIKATRVTIYPGNKEVSWTHSYGSNNYAVSHIADSPSRHIYISESTTNSVTLAIDDEADEDITIHLTLIGW